MQTAHPDAAPIWSFHEDHKAAVSEPHARPPMPIEPRDTVLHLGLKCAAPARLSLFGILGIDPEMTTERHWMKTCDGFRLKLEQHTEFMSLTMLVCDGGDASAGHDLLARIAAVDGLEAITLTRIVMGRILDDAPRGPLFGGRMRGGMDVRTSLVPDAAGFITYHVQAPDGSPEETGRRVQRVIEMETYRTLCLLGLPVARRTGEALAGHENALIRIVSDMSPDHPDNDEALFQALSRLLQTSNAQRAATRYRFAASRAYYNLVQQRLTSLEETDMDDLQTISGFVRSRLEPSMATIESVAARQKTLIDDLSQALSLLRTRIDLALNRDNQSLLKSLDARNRQQVLIAQTVEGLSAVAITYYAVGLLSYVLKSAAFALPPPLSHSTLVAVSVPVVLIAVWTSLHRMRGKWDKEG